MAQIETFESLPIFDAGGRALIAKKISFPNDGADFGNSGDQLRSLGNGGVEWAAPGMPTYEQTEQAVSDWLNAHPEATTTVQNNSITEEKLNSTLKGNLVFESEMKSNVVVIADSYGDSAHGGTQVTSFLTILQSIFDSRSDDIETGFSRGAGFTITNNSFHNVLNSVYQNSTSDFNDRVERVFVVGGFNDRNASYAALHAAVDSFIADAYSKYPNLRTICMCPVGMAIEDRTGASSFTYKQIADLHTYYKRIEAESNIVVAANAFMVMRTTGSFVSDYLHPSDIGNRKIADFVIHAIDGIQWSNATYDGASNDFTENFGVVSTLDNCTGIGGITLGIRANGAYGHIKSTVTKLIVRFEGDTKFSLNASGAAESELCGWAPNAALQNSSIVDIKIPCPVTLKVGSVFIECTGCLHFKNKKIYVSAQHINEAGTAFDNYTDIERVTCNLNSTPTINMLSLFG